MALPWSVSQILRQLTGKECCFTLIPRLIKQDTKVWNLAAASTPEMLEWLSALHTASTAIPSTEDLSKEVNNEYQMIEDTFAKKTKET